MRRIHRAKAQGQGLSMLRYLKKEEIDATVYEYTLISTPSQYWRPRVPPPPSEVFSVVTVYDAEGRVVRVISHADLQAREGVGKLRHGSHWMGPEGWKNRKGPKKDKYLWTERGSSAR